MHGNLVLLDLFAKRGQKRHGGNDTLLCNKAGQRGSNRLPGTKAQRSKDRSQNAADGSQQRVCRLNQTEGSVHEAEAAEEPHYCAAQEQDGSCLLNECPYTLPYVKENALQGRKVISRKLHNERYRITGEELCLLEDDAVDDNQCDACKIHAGSHPPCAAHQVAGDQSDNRKLGTARNHCCGDHGHPAVLLRLDGTSGHDAGYAAAGGNQERNEALSGKSELAEDTVHDEGNACHVSNVLQEAQEQEDNGHLRNEADRCCNTADNAVNHKRDQPVRCTGIGQQCLYAGLNPLAEQRIVCPVGNHAAEGADRHIVNQEHNCGKNRKRQPSVGNDAVHLIGGSQSAGLLALLNRLLNQVGDVCVSLVGDDGFCIIIHFLLTILDVLFHVAHQRGINGKLLQSLGITLKDLDREPAKLLRIYDILNGLLDVCDGMLYTAGEDMRKLFLLARLCSLDAEICRIHRVLVLKSGDLDNLATKLLAQLLDIDAVAVLANQIHHVDGDDNRNTDLHQLCGQVQVTLNVRAVHDVQDGIRLLVYEIVTGNNLLQCVRAQGIDTRKVLNHNILVVLETSFLFLYGNARPVTNILVAAGQVIKQGSFTAVRITCQCDFDFHLLLLLFLFRICLAPAILQREPSACRQTHD